ncbi:MAG: NAD(P)H-dependent oxidoreductase subunit E [Candidatus Hydrogenedentota bacterium]
MAVTQKDRLKTEVAAWIADFGGNRGALLPTLQELHQRYGRVSAEAQQVVADLLHIHPAEVYGVLTFYNFINHETRGQFVVRLCRTLSCEMAGKAAVEKALTDALGIGFGQTTEDGRFTLEYASCLGMCDQGPAMLVNDRVYTKVTPAQIPEILENCKRSFASYAGDRKEAF